MCSSRRLLLALACLVGGVVPVAAQVAVSEAQSQSGNDVAIVLGAAPAATDRVLVLVAMGNESQTIDLTGFDVTETLLYGPIDHTTTALRAYAFCMAGNGTDTTFTVATSGGASADSLIVVASGLNACASIVDDAEFTEFAASSSQSLTTDLVTTQSGDLILGMTASGTVMDYSPAGGYTQISDDASNAGGEYKVAGAAGTEDPASTTAANETGFLIGLALKASGVAGSSVGPYRLRRP